MKRNCVIYENVRVEMARKNLTILDIAQNIGYNVPYKVDTARGRDCLKC